MFELKTAAIASQLTVNMRICVFINWLIFNRIGLRFSNIFMRKAHLTYYACWFYFGLYRILKLSTDRHLLKFVCV
jgi:hypothetical protein